MKLNIVVMTAFIFFSIFMLVELRHLKESFLAICAECDASEAFVGWRIRNPAVYIGLSDEGKYLLRQWVRALDKFAHTHPYCDCREKREWLLSLFDDLPPKPPRSFPPKGTRGVPFSMGENICFVY